jgi:hypothetical protein
LAKFVDCRDIIAELYEDKEVNKLINKLDPPELREDLRQEFAVILLDYSCEKLIEAKENGKIVYLAIRILLNMATGTNGYFYRTYRRNRVIEDHEYNKTYSKTIDYIPSAKIARDVLDKKLLLDANEAHESIIFDKYVELRSCKKVADYYGIPQLHVFQVVKKTRNQLKKEIKRRL